MILDSITPRERNCDICVVGSGPVGMALAMEFERLGRSVLLLESGGREFDPSLADASRAEIVDANRHAPMELAVCRALGGTSWTWGGRCVAFDDIDFQARQYVSYSGWPFQHEEVRRWYADAARYLFCGDNTMSSPSELLSDLGDDITTCALERWSAMPQLARRHKERLEQSRLITVCLNSTVVDLDLGEWGAGVQEVLVRGRNGPSRVRAREVILAAGGIETTRLLLSVQRRWRGHFGGTDGPLGRYYMGHISGKIAGIAICPPKAADDLDFELDRTGTYVRRRFLLSESAQKEYALLNTAFFPDNFPFYDPRHRSCVLSAVWLALAWPAIGRRILPEAIRRFHVGPKPYPVAKHIGNLIADGPRGVRQLSRVLHEKFFSSPRKPGFLVRNRDGHYALHYHAEQEPNPDSRVVLIGEDDAFGMPRVAIDLRFTRNDADSVLRSHQVLDSALRKHSAGYIEYWHPEQERFAAVMSQARDGFHQAGTTRMGTHPATSVVDPDLKTHDVGNLHVASSSVFPTTGQANSTFLAVALAVRLAHHLCSKETAVRPLAANVEHRASH